MKKYLNKVNLGDCLDIMKDIPDNSIDCVVTDPPYQLSSTTKKRTDDIAVKGKDGKGNPFCRQQAQKGFMGKEWDVMPSVDIWKECLRIMKHGAFAFICMTPRQDSMCLVISRLQEAGFQTGFTSIYWCYASGFPKASNISKMVDKRLSVKQDEIDYEHPQRKNRNSTYTTGFSNSEDRKRGDNSKIKKGVATSNEAKALDGSYGGFQPKPAVEIILVVMKPLSEKTFVDQAMKNGKGITWLDDGRIPKADDDRFEYGVDGIKRSNNNNVYGKQYGNIEFSGKEGRFPANLLCSDDVLNDGIFRQPAGNKNISHRKSGFGCDNKLIGSEYNDGQSFSRYFSLDAWFEDKIKQLSPEVQKIFPFLIVPKAAKSEKNEGCDELPKGKPPASARSKPAEGRKNALGEPRQNFHPTCKPVKLMSYLITLGSREKDIILDPFAGSCTTAIACDILGRQFIMIEREKEYYEIGKVRIEYERSQMKLF